jgi:hypothetical protein
MSTGEGMRSGLVDLRCPDAGILAFWDMWNTRWKKRRWMLLRAGGGGAGGGEGEEGRMMVRDITAAACHGCRDRDREETDAGRRLESAAEGGEGGGGGEVRSGGRRARLLARRSDGLTILLPPLTGPRAGYGGNLVALLIQNPFMSPSPPAIAACRTLSISCMAPTIRTSSSTIPLNSLMRRSIPLISLRIFANISSIWVWVSFISSTLTSMYRCQSSRWIRRVISPGLMRSRNV